MSPEFEPGHGWRPLGTIGVRFREMHLALEYTDRKLNWVNPISAYVGEFFPRWAIMGKTYDRRLSYT